MFRFNFYKKEFPFSSFLVILLTFLLAFGYVNRKEIIATIGKINVSLKRTPAKEDLKVASSKPSKNLPRDTGYQLKSVLIVGDEKYVLFSDQNGEYYMLKEGMEVGSLSVVAVTLDSVVLNKGHGERVVLRW